MSGYEVQVGQLRTAAKAAGSAADQARSVDPGIGLAAIATALPGGEAAKNAPALAATLTERANGWAGEIEGWSDSITKAANMYSENEESAEEVFGG